MVYTYKMKTMKEKELHLRQATSLIGQNPGQSPTPPVYSALIGHMANSVVIGLLLTAGVKTPITISEF